jgi:hypothetical protein
VRDSAYKALAKLNTQTSLEKLVALYAKNKAKPTNLSAIVEALVSTELPFFFKEVYEQVVESFNEFINLGVDADEKLLAEKLDLFETHLEVLKNKNNTPVRPFLSNFLTNTTYHQITAKKKKLEWTVKRIAGKIIKIIDSFEAKDKLSFYEENIPNIPDSALTDDFWYNYIKAAVKGGYSPKKFFDTFHQPLLKKIISVDELHRYVMAEHSLNSYELNLQFKNNILDEQWAPVLYSLLENKTRLDRDFDMALRILHNIDKKNKKLDNLLVDVSKKFPAEHCSIVFRLMVAREVPKCFELIFSSMEKLPKNTYWRHVTGESIWLKFPKEYEAKFRKLHDKTGIELFQNIAEVMAGHLPETE